MCPSAPPSSHKNALSQHADKPPGNCCSQGGGFLFFFIGTKHACKQGGKGLNKFWVHEFSAADLSNLTKKKKGRREKGFQRSCCAAFPVLLISSFSTVFQNTRFNTPHLLYTNVALLCPEEEEKAAPVPPFWRHVPFSPFCPAIRPAPGYTSQGPGILVIQCTLPLPSALHLRMSLRRKERHGGGKGVCSSRSHPCTK